MVGNNQTDKFLCRFLSLLSLLPLLTAIYPGYTVNSYQITEWLINYQGGFVRRGLPGEVILALSKRGINPYFVIMGLSFGTWLVLILLLFKLSVRRCFPSLVIFSQLCMLAPVIGHQIVRKDCLIILLFVLALYFFQQRGTKSVLLANSISGLAVLSHEVYGFVSIPMFFIVKYADWNESLSNEPGNRWGTVTRRNRFIYAATCITPLLVLFVLCLVYHGNASVADSVWSSWQNQFQFFPGSSNPDLVAQRRAEVEVLGWSVAQEIQCCSLLPTLRDFSFIAWIATTALVASYLLLLYRSHLITLRVAEFEAKDEVSCFVRILFVQFVAILPLWVATWDYGRLIFLWAASSISSFLVLTPCRRQEVSSFVSHAISLLPATIRDALEIVRHACARGLASTMITSRRVTLTKLSLLLFGIPVCCWSPAQYVAYTPLVQPFYYAIHAVRVGWGPPQRIISDVSAY